MQSVGQKEECWWWPGTIMIENESYIVYGELRETGKREWGEEIYNDKQFTIVRLFNGTLE